MCGTTDMSFIKMFEKIKSARNLEIIEIRGMLNPGKIIIDSIFDLAESWNGNCVLTINAFFGISGLYHISHSFF